MIISYLIEKELGVSAYMICTISGFIAIALSVLFAEKKAAKKFNKDSGEM